MEVMKVYLDSADRNMISEAAQQRGCSASSYVRDLVRLAAPDALDSAEAKRYHRDLVPNLLGKLIPVFESAAERNDDYARGCLYVISAILDDSLRTLESAPQEAVQRLAGFCRSGHYSFQAGRR